MTLTWRYCRGGIFQEMILHSNQLQETEPGAFCGLEILGTLDLRFNKLTEVTELTPLKLTLVKLFLTDNQLSRFPDDYFQGFVRLRYLDVGVNHLQAVPQVGWLPSTLLILGLRENNIASTEGSATQNPFNKLHEINLNDNQINAFDVKILRRMPKLMYLYLRRNSLTYLDDYRPFFSNTPIVSGNPFHCDVRMSWMSSIKGKFQHKPTCATPWCLKGKVILNMSKYLHYIL